jgi:hypothetical protein
MYSAGFKNRPLLRFYVWLFLGVWCWQTAAFAQEQAAPKAARSALRMAAKFPALSNAQGLPTRTIGLRHRGLEQRLFLSSSRVGRADEKKRLRPGLYLSAAVAVSAGVLALWSKREADRAYDRYAHAAGQTRQAEQFDRAEGYDRISGAAFVAMEAGIALTTYLVFF